MATTGATESGYSTQAAVSLQVAELINGNRLNFWFAKDFNPIENLSTSNPLWIYDQLDRACKTGRHNAKSEDVEGNLMAWVLAQRVASAPLPSNVGCGEGLRKRQFIGEALAAIIDALGSGGFEPRVFYLHGVTNATRESQPDEYHVTELEIASSIVHQILPPSGESEYGRRERFLTAEQPLI